MQYFTAHNIDIPKLGFGTWTLKGDDCINCIEHAIDTGYRHFDTAQAYDNEEFVGQSIKNAPIDRDNLFVTTKIFRDQFETKQKAIESLHESLKKLQMDYVDLTLIHWPFPEYELEQLIEPLMELQDDGKTRLIGVSNFTTDHMQKAKEISDNRICMNQVEYHPHLNQDPVLDFCRQNGWGMTAYSPLGRGDALNDDTIQELAEKHNKSEGQIILRWLIQQDNVLAIPKSSHEGRITENFDIFNFELSDEDMQAIMECRQANDRQVDPDFAPQWDKAA
jgi:diketogulonate reductase-like aldo/keto reductase